jgi:large subunit ribosomal protein L14
MIQTQTLLKVADNSGAKTVKCIGLMTSQKVAKVGDCIIVSVRSVRSSLSGKTKKGGGSNTFSSNAQKNSNLDGKAVQKGQIFKALVLRTKKGICNRKYGHTLSFETNDVVLIDNQNKIVGSRIFGPITRELRAKN